MAEQVWESTIEGRVHRVVASGSVMRTVTWSVDGEAIAEEKSLDERMTLRAGRGGSVQVRFTSLGAPRRATLFQAEGLGELGVGGVDLAPVAGSPAALHDARLLAHPTRYTAIATLAAVAKVVVPILLAGLAFRFLPAIPWPDLPDLPRIPWPDIPWPDITTWPWPDVPVIRFPDIPWPDIPWPDVSLPAWVRWILEHAKYIIPIVVAFSLARAEVRRRRKHAEELQTRQRATTTDDASTPATDG